MNPLSPQPGGEPTQVTPIHISRIVRDPGFNARSGGTVKAHLERLKAASLEDLPPLLVTPIDDGNFLLLDGNHRLAVMEDAHMEQIPCRVVADGDFQHAFEANHGHGLPLSIDDRKAYAEWLHKHESHLSCREIGRRCGLHHQTVKAVIEKKPEPATDALLVRMPPKTAEKIVRLVKVAHESKDGVGFWNGDKRASMIKKAFGSYSDEVREEMAADLAAWGRAMQEVAETYLQM